MHKTKKCETTQTSFIVIVDDLRRLQHIYLDFFPSLAALIHICWTLVVVFTTYLQFRK